MNNINDNALFSIDEMLYVYDIINRLEKTKELKRNIDYRDD